METLKANAVETANCLPFGRLVDALDHGFATGCTQPERHHIKIEKNNQTTPMMLLMPAWSKADDDRQYLGVKVVNIYPDNRLKNLPGLNSTYVLYNGDTGEELAIFDGNTLTARRTAATSALAARYLAPAQAEKLAIIGAGEVANLLPEAFSVVRPIKEVIIWNRTEQAASHLAQRLISKGFSVRVAETVEQAVCDADIVSAATLSTKPLIHGTWLKRGAHIDLIGAFSPHMRESDDDLVRKAKIYIDTPEAINEAGDLSQPIAKGVIQKSDVIATLSDLAKRHQNVVRNDGEITLFKAVGSGLADLYAATLAFETMNVKLKT
ncbi:ornithine cyclodeaminase family protein [uncultured Bartonella sp.]|uniref:ornithine cyclodeaminase family protein n=1 Tax=uncultured Bartonella sp. TaxID=104108 RepID=UPI00261AA55D|nr:ornithine cyclodeaminase family protein [uncultured Bartonella sp.]